jgi:hypothetical protein
VCLLQQCRAPCSLAVCWCAAWGFATAGVRLAAGEHPCAFIERGPNWGAPLALGILQATGAAADACPGPWSLSGAPGIVAWAAAMVAGLATTSLALRLIFRKA